MMLRHTNEPSKITCAIIRFNESCQEKKNLLRKVAILVAYQNRDIVIDLRGKYCILLLTCVASILYCY